jgi:hypothetical protein
VATDRQALPDPDQAAERHLRLWIFLDPDQRVARSRWIDRSKRLTISPNKRAYNIRDKGWNRMNPETIKCRCGNVIGEVIRVSGLELLHSGGGVFREVHGNCVQCGYGIHWTFADKKLQAIIKSIRIVSTETDN